MAYIYDLTDTWNAGGTTFNGIKLNVTDSASAVSSKLVNLQTNGTEHFSVTKAGVGYFSGNVGIGTSSPARTLSVFSASSIPAQIESSGTDARISIITSSGSGGQGFVQASSGALLLGSSNTERARIDASGNLLVGTTSTTPGQTGIIMQPAVAGSIGVVDICHANGVATGNPYQRYYYNATEIGSISQNGTTAVAYNTSSDYRLKDIDGPVANSGAYIDALKPVQGSWKADGSRFIGLLAHEVQEVSETPIATGEKDGEKMQAMDYSAPEIIANLIAELQSVRARLAQLEGAA